jgi:hypothetical protein
MPLVEERIRLLSMVGICKPLSAKELERLNGCFLNCTQSSIRYSMVRGQNRKAVHTLALLL